MQGPGLLCITNYVLKFDDNVTLSNEELLSAATLSTLATHRPSDVCSSTYVASQFLWAIFFEDNYPGRI